MLKGMRIVEMSFVCFYLSYRDLFNDAVSMQWCIASYDTMGDELDKKRLYPNRNYYNNCFI
jgi:hypothetical protein